MPPIKRNTENLTANRLKAKEMNLQHGVLGKLFGSNNSVPQYIVGIAIIILLITASLYTFFPNDKLDAKELWGIVIPVVTTILGYIFGSLSKSGTQQENEV